MSRARYRVKRKRLQKAQPALGPARLISRAFERAGASQHSKHVRIKLRDYTCPVSTRDLSSNFRVGAENHPARSLRV